MEIEEIEAAIIEIIKEITEGWDLEPEEIRPESSLLEDIGLSSVDALHLMATFNMRFQRSLPYEELFTLEADRLRRLTVAQMAQFVHKNFNQTSVLKKP